MKKIEIIKKVTEINNSVVSACGFIANEDKFKTIIDKFFSEVGSDSDNFRSVMSYYHGGKRIEDFISGVNYYMNTNLYYTQCIHSFFLHILNFLLIFLLKTFEILKFHSLNEYSVYSKHL